MSEKSTAEEIIDRLEMIKNAPTGSGGSSKSFVVEQLEHEHDGVRAKAASCMWEYPGEDVADTVLELAKNDPCEQVRVNAIKSLGMYMHEGDMEMFESDDGPWEDPYTERSMTVDQYERMRDFLLGTFRDRDGSSLDERRYALEALSFLPRDDVQEFIKEGFDSDRKEMKISALFAMSRTKHGKWADPILESLHSDAEEVRYEAMRAAGECEIEEAHRTLKRIASSTDDQDTFRQAVMSIANLGLQKSFTYLDNLNRESRVDVEPEFARHAMDKWMFKNKVRKDREERE